VVVSELLRRLSFILCSGVVALLCGSLLGASVAQGQGIPQSTRTPGELVWSAVGGGRNAIAAYIGNGRMLAVPMESGSPSGSDLLPRLLNLSNPSSPTVAFMPEMGRGSALAAHGYYHEGTSTGPIFAGPSGQNYSFEWRLNPSTGILTNVWGQDARMYAYLGANYPEWPGFGLRFQPFISAMWWNYNATTNSGILYKRQTHLSTWDHIGLTGVIGHPVLVGNTYYVLGDSSQTGIAAYRINNVLENPGTTQPELLGVLNAPVGGYHPNIFGLNGRLYVFFPNRTSGGSDRFSIADITDPTNMFVVAERAIPGEQDIGYVNFQDNFAFTGPYKIDLENPNYPVALQFNTTPATMMNQFVVPIGNMVFGAGVPGLSIWAHQAAPDTRGPSVGFHRPFAGETNYPRGAFITLMVHETLEMSTVIPGQTFVVRPVVNGQYGAVVPGRVFHDHSGQMNFAPDEDFLPNTTYEVRLPAGGIRDAVGNGVAEFAFTFSTGSNVAGNQPPIISSFTAAPLPIQPNQAATLAVVANDPENSALSYRFSFGDGSPMTVWGSQSSVQHTYTAPGHYRATVSVRDAAGMVSLQTVVVTVMNPPPAGVHATSSSTAALHSASGAVWVVNSDSGSVTRVDVNNTTQEISLGVGSDPQSVAVDSQGNAWVTCRGSDRIAIVSPSGVVSQNLLLPYGTQPHGITPNPSGSSMYVTAFGSGKLLRFDTANRSQTGSLNLGPTPRAIAITQDGARALVTRYISPDQEGQVWVVSLGATMSLSRTVTLARDFRTIENSSSARGLPNLLESIAIQPGTNRAWVTFSKANIIEGLFNSGRDNRQDGIVRAGVAEIDITSGNENEVYNARRDIDNSADPSGIGFSPLGDWAFVTLRGNDTLVIYEALIPGENYLTLVPTAGRLDTGRAPRGFVVDGMRRRLIVSNNLSRSISIIDLAGFLAGTTSNPPKIELNTTSLDPLTPQELRGKQIFYNASDGEGPNGTNRMSGEGYISCASCHPDGGHDGRTWDFTGRGEGVRNTTDLRGRRGMAHGLVHWSANFDEIQDFENDIRNVFGGSGFMSNADFAATSNPLGTPKAGRSTDLDALAAYVASLDRDSYPRSPHRNPDGSMSLAAQRGLDVFVNENCMSCHVPWRLTDSSAPTPTLHNVGTMSAASGNRLGGPLPGIDTPTLFSLAATAPYFHNGEASTLEEVFEYAGGQRIQAENANQIINGTVSRHESWQTGAAHNERLVHCNNAPCRMVYTVNSTTAGPGYVTIRFSSNNSVAYGTLVVNGASQPIHFPTTLNFPAWWFSVFKEVKVPVTFQAGTNTIEVDSGPTYFVVAFDDVLIATPDDLARTLPHRRVLGIDAGMRADLMQFLRELDGSDDQSAAQGTPTPLPTGTATPLPTATATPTRTPTIVPTATATPTRTPTSVPTATPTVAATPTRTPTSVPTSTATPLPTSTSTPLPTATPIPTHTMTPVPTATPTPLPTSTATPLPTSTPQPTATPISDITPPNVVFNQPSAGASFTTRLTIKASASDTQSGVKSIRISVNGVVRKTCLGTSSCTVRINTSSFSVGAHTIDATAYDNAGNKRTILRTVYRK